MMEVRNRRSGIKGQEEKVRRQRSEIGGQGKRMGAGG